MSARSPFDVLHRRHRWTAECREVHPVQPAGGTEARAGGRPAGLDARPARGRATPAHSLIDTAGLERGIRTDDARASGRKRRSQRRSCCSRRADGRGGGRRDLRRACADLRQTVVLAVNKGGRGQTCALQTYALGLGEPLPVDQHDIIGELAAAIEQACRERAGGGEEEGREPAQAPEHPLRIAIVGRPNVGKSTLINTLLGEERMITGPEAGITRDAIASSLAWGGRSLLLFDTAGLRRKMRVEGRAETLSVGDALKAIRFAEIVVLLLDAEQPFEKQDLQIADLIAQEGRALVIAVNKWDLVRDPGKRLSLRETCQRLLPQVKGVALVPVSATAGTGLDKLMKAILAADALWNLRLPTHALNEWLQGAVEAHSPPACQDAGSSSDMSPRPMRAADLLLFCSLGAAGVLRAIS
jgi:GTP-binding protein